MKITEPGFEEPNGRNENSKQPEMLPVKPITRRAKVIVVTDDIGKRLLYGEFEETFMNENKGIDIETRAEKGMLDCGHEWKKDMHLHRCWRGHLVCQDHAHRCPSGRVVCEHPKCGKSYFGKWYSSFWQFLFDKTIGCRGLGKVKNKGREISVKKNNPR